MSVSSFSGFKNLSATDDALEVACGGYGTVGIQLAGTWTGTVTFEGTVDHGSWQTLNVTKTNSTSQVTTATGNGVWTGPVAGLLAVRARFSTASSGMVQARMLVAGTGGGSGSSGGGGGGGGTSSDFNAAFPAQGTAAGFEFGGNMVPGTLNADGGLEVHVNNGGSGGNTAAGPTGDPVPTDADFQGFENPSGDLEGVKDETFDVNTGAGTDNKTVRMIGRATPTGGLPISQAVGMPVSGNTVKDGTGTELRELVDADGHQQVDVLTSPGLTDAQLRAAPVPVSLASAPTTAVTVADGADATQGAIADAAVDTDTTGTLSGKLRGLVKLWVNYLTRFPASLGQGTMAQSLPVVLASNQTSVGVTVASKTVYTRPVYGTAQTVFNSSTDIAGGAFSAAGTDFTNNDGTIGAAMYADAMIEMPDWAAAPVAGTVVQLWGLLINTDGTDDDTDAPSAAAPGGARLLCSWTIAAADALQRRTMPISLAGIQSGFTPYIFNGTAQNMNNDGGTNMVVKITPWNLAQVG